jgi:hypothetical protein
MLGMLGISGTLKHVLNYKVKWVLAPFRKAFVLLKYFAHHLMELRAAQHGRSLSEIEREKIDHSRAKAVQLKNEVLRILHGAKRHPFRAMAMVANMLWSFLIHSAGFGDVVTIVSHATGILEALSDELTRGLKDRRVDFKMQCIACYLNAPGPIAAKLKELSQNTALCGVSGTDTHHDFANAAQKGTFKYTGYVKRVADVILAPANALALAVDGKGDVKMDLPRMLGTRLLGRSTEYWDLAIHEKKFVKNNMQLAKTACNRMDAELAEDIAESLGTDKALIPFEEGMTPQGTKCENWQPGVTKDMWVRLAAEMGL